MMSTQTDCEVRLRTCDRPDSGTKLMHANIRATALQQLPHSICPRRANVNPTFLSNSTFNLLGPSRIEANPSGTGTVASLRGTAAATSASVVIDTSCGETATPFAITAHSSSSESAGGVLDGWYVSVSGQGLLLVPDVARASKFSIEASGHLCAVGYTAPAIVASNGTELSPDGGPSIATVETRNLTEGRPEGSPLWLAGSKTVATVEQLRNNYAPVQCATASGVLACVAGKLGQWMSCGLELALGNSTTAGSRVDGLECFALALSVG